MKHMSPIWFILLLLAVVIIVIQALARTHFPGISFWTLTGVVIVGFLAVYVPVCLILFPRQKPVKMDWETPEHDYDGPEEKG